jgi:hypothetical protein
MNFKEYLLFMTIGTVLAWGAWVFVLLRVDPGENGLIGLLLFYVTLFVALIGILAIAGVLYRVKLLKRHQLVSREVKIAFRHAIIFAGVAVICLALSAQGLLFWWNVLALFALVGLVEYGFLLVQESRRS